MDQEAGNARVSSAEEDIDAQQNRVPVPEAAKLHVIQRVSDKSVAVVKYHLVTPSIGLLAPQSHASIELIQPGGPIGIQWHIPM